MTRICTAIIIFAFHFIVSLNAHPVYGWYEQTHMAIVKAAGYSNWYNAAGPDITKIKAGKVEAYNHFFNNNDSLEVTPEMVLKQAERYNDPEDAEGHIYGAIIASLREYRERMNIRTQYSAHYFAFFIHYIGDFSNPLHNIPYDDFNRSRHGTNDGIVENEVLNNINKIEHHMYKIDLRHDHLEEDLAIEIARIANGARLLGYTLKKDNRNMTKSEAYVQLGHSASLLKAVLKHFNKGGKTK